jgi:iron only hydrogenase large subunit-like protein
MNYIGFEDAMDFSELYKGLLHATVKNRRDDYIKALHKTQSDDGIDCLLHPERYAPVWPTAPCDCSADDAGCIKRCIFSAICRDSDGNLFVDKDRCVGCAECIDACSSGKLTASTDILPVLDALKNTQSPVYALVAPAFIGQFGETSPGQLRSALKAIGFAGMIEVALFADILTLKEALVFDRKIISREDFMLTSCCCPIWIAMIRRSYGQYLKNMPDSVSPMVACGRAIKKMKPSAVTVFIGPCMAKKVEAREKDIADAVDFVLTFEEIRDVFSAFHLEPSGMSVDGKEHSSAAGRIYGKTGGVSEAVRNTVHRLNPDRRIDVTSEQADGTKDCRALLERLKANGIRANYLEGMGCEGGCVGGPKVLIDPGNGRENLEIYGKNAAFDTPLDNPYILELLRALGYDTIESLLGETIFTRHFEYPIVLSGRQ